MSWCPGAEPTHWLIGKKRFIWGLYNLGSFQRVPGPFLQPVVIFITSVRRSVTQCPYDKPLRRGGQPAVEERPLWLQSCSARGAQLSMRPREPGEPVCSASSLLVRPAPHPHTHTQMLYFITTLCGTDNLCAPVPLKWITIKQVVNKYNFFK